VNIYVWSNVGPLNGHGEHGSVVAVGDDLFEAKIAALLKAGTTAPVMSIGARQAFVKSLEQHPPKVELLWDTPDAVLYPDPALPKWEG
jgi:hypothetical protein